MSGAEFGGPNGGAQVTPRKPKPRWTPELGASVPDFQVETTRGTLTYRPWSAGYWTYLFAFPSTFASVCSTELIAFAGQRAAFEAMGIKIMGITPAGLKETLEWVLDLEKVFGLDIHFPIAADEEGELLRHLGMIQAPMGGRLESRPSLFTDSENKLRMYTNYPIRMGRSTAEVLRCFEGMKDLDYSGLAIPADWRPGDDLVAPKGVNAQEMQRVFGDDWSKVSEYLYVAHVSQK